MKRFTSTEFFFTLQETSQKGIEADAGVLKNWYDEFAMLLFTKGTACTDRTTHYRSLVYTRLELESMTRVTGEKHSVLY